MQNTHDISPDANILDVFAASGYTIKTAIADIIDNSISAGASKIDINWLYKEQPQRLTILDNGVGMNLQSMLDAATAAKKNIKSHRKKTDLGRFSMGLKSASVSFCDNLSIYSKTKNHNINKVDINFDYIRKTKKWNAISTTNTICKQLNDFDSGTMIEWHKLKILNNTIYNDDRFILNALQEIETHLSHVFGEIIKTKKIKITINNSKRCISSWDPFMTKHPKTKIIFDDVIPYEKRSMQIKAYILPTLTKLDKTDYKIMQGYGLSEQQGFYIYRNNRLISEGGWLDLDGLQNVNKANYARIRVDIDPTFDERFKVNFAKSQILLPQELKQRFLKIARLARSESNKNYDYMKQPRIKRKIINKKDIPVWDHRVINSEIFLSINSNNPVLEELTKNLTRYEKKRLYKYFEANIPIGLIQSQNISNHSYTKDELFELMESFFNSEKKSNVFIDNIKSKMASVEPFSKNMDSLIEFFNIKEGKNE